MHGSNLVGWCYLNLEREEQGSKERALGLSHSKERGSRLGSEEEEEQFESSWLWEVEM